MRSLYCKRCTSLPEPRGAAHAAGVAVFRAHQLRVDAIREHVRGPQRGDALVEAARCSTARRQATITSGIDDVDDRGDRAREAPLVALEARRGARRRRRRRARRHRSPTRRRHREPHGRAPVPDRTGTFRCIPIVRNNTADPGRSSSRGAGSGLCPHSPAMALAPIDDPAIDDEPAAGAGADDDAEHDRRSGGGAVGRFGQREAVRIVRQPHRPIERARQIAIERTAVQPRRVRVLDRVRSPAKSLRECRCRRCRARRVSALEMRQRGRTIATNGVAS